MPSTNIQGKYRFKLEFLLSKFLFFTLPYIYDDNFFPVYTIGLSLILLKESSSGLLRLKMLDAAVKGINPVDIHNQVERQYLGFNIVFGQYTKIMMLGKNNGIILYRFFGADMVFENTFSGSIDVATLFEIQGTNILFSPHKVLLEKRASLSTNPDVDFSEYWFLYTLNHFTRLTENKVLWVSETSYWSEAEASGSVSLYARSLTISQDEIEVGARHEIDNTSVIISGYGSVGFPNIPESINFSTAWRFGSLISLDGELSVFVFLRDVYGLQFYSTIYAIGISLSGTSLFAGTPVSIFSENTEKPYKIEGCVSLSSTKAIVCFTLLESHSSSLNKNRRFLSILTFTGVNGSASSVIEIPPVYWPLYHESFSLLFRMVGDEDYLLLMFNACTSEAGCVADFPDYPAIARIQLFKINGSTLTLLSTIEPPYASFYHRYAGNPGASHIFHLSNKVFFGCNLAYSTDSDGKTIKPFGYLLTIKDDDLICSDPIDLENLNYPSSEYGYTSGGIIIDT